MDRLGSIAQGKVQPESVEELEARLESNKQSKKKRLDAEDMVVDNETDDDPYLYSDGEDTAGLKMTTIAQGVYTKHHQEGLID